MAIPHYQFSFGDALLAAASMVREDRLRREQMALQERQFQRDLALRQKELEQQERQSVRTDRTTRRGQNIHRDLGFAGISTTRRGQDLTFESGERDRRQRGAFHQDNMDLAREQMLNAREVARISSGGSAANDFLRRVGAFQALYEMGFDVHPAEFDIPISGDLRGGSFTPPPPSAPFLATAGNVTAPFAGLLDITGGPQNRLFVTRGQKREAAEQYVSDYLTTLEEDLASRGRLTQEEAALYLQRLNDAVIQIRGNESVKGNPNLTPTSVTRFVDRIAAMRALVSSKTRK